MSKQYIFLLILILIVGVLAGLGYIKYRSYKAMTYQSDAKTAHETFVSGDYKNSADQLTTLVAQAPNKSEMGRLKILLGVSYWYRNQNNDSAQAVKILKEVVNDYSIPAAWRAQALNSIARFVQDSSLAFYQLHFSEVPYSTFVPAEGTETQKLNAVYLALLKYSDDTYPTSWAEYAIAYHYASLSASSSKDAELKQYVQMMQLYVQDGDSRQDQSIYSPSVLIQSYYYRALSIARSAVLEGLTPESIKKVEEAYRRVFETSTRLDQDERGVQLLLRTRFYNANFLSMQTGREVEVQELLKPFATKDASTAGIFFTSLKDVPDTNFNKVVAIKLAKISPDFNLFLSRVGVLIK